MKEDIYWGDSHYIKWDKKLFDYLSISSDDIRALCVLGLPEWVAPNINFGIYGITPSGIKLGEDREDRNIVLSFDTKKIYVGNEMQFMNSSALQLRGALKLYAEMIEDTLAKDENSFVENRIDINLVKKLKNSLKSLDTDCLAVNSFWSTELSRLIS